MFAELAAETRLLVTAEGRDRIKYPVTVDPYGAGPETAREFGRAIDVPGPYRGRESVNGVVCLQHRIGFGLERNQGSDRAKNFLAGYPHAALDIGEDRRPDEVAPGLRSALAAGAELGSLLLADLQITEHTLVLFIGDERPHRRAGLKRISQGYAQCGLREPFCEFVIGFLLDENSRARAAHLPLVSENSRRRTGRRQLQVGVVEDNVR